MGGRALSTSAGRRLLQVYSVDCNPAQSALLELKAVGWWGMVAGWDGLQAGVALAGGVNV